MSFPRATLSVIRVISCHLFVLEQIGVTANTIPQVNGVK